MGDPAFTEMKEDIEDAFHKGHVQEVLLLMDKHFGTHNYSFWHLFKDDQKRIIDQVLESTLVGIEGMFRAIYENNYPLMRAFNELNMSLPMPLKITGDFIVNSKIKRILGSKSVDLKELRNIKDEIARLKVELDTVTLNYIATKRVSEFVDKLELNPEDLDVMKDTIDLIEVCMQIPLQPDLWEVDNVAFRIRENYYALMQEKSESDVSAKNWIDVFDNLISHLNLKPIPINESIKTEKSEETYLVT
jgi:hypothetical protein